GARRRHARGAHRVPDRAGGVGQPGHADGRDRAAAPGRGRGEGTRRARPASAAGRARAGGGRVSTSFDYTAFAENYDRLLVPAIFAPLAGAVADSVEAAHGDRALDVACGTGALTRVLAERVQPDGEVTGLDLAEGMLAIARSRGGGINYVRGTADDLPF